MNNVFVYGTLKKGQHANHLMGDAFVGDAYLAGYNLFDLGGFPTIIKQQEGEDLQEVHGDLYEVTDEQLKKLDRYEGIENGLFKREKVIVTYYDGGETEYECFVYVWGKPTPPAFSKPIHLSWPPNAA